MKRSSLSGKSIKSNMHTRHIIKAYSLKTKCSTDHTSCRLVGVGQTIQAVHFTFLSCLSLPQVQAVESLIEKLKEERVRLIAFKKYHLPNNGKANHLPNRSELGYIGYSYFMLFHFPKTVTMSCRFRLKDFSANAPHFTFFLFGNKKKTANLSSFFHQMWPSRQAKVIWRKLGVFLEDPSLIYDPKLAVFKESIRDLFVD